MTYGQIRTCLEQAGIPDADAEAQLLLSHYSNRSRESLFAEPAFDCTDPALADAVARRLAHEPLQYIFGSWSFFDLPFRVTPDCLIPRYDTEILVETALSVLPPHAFFADLCTGSGCIAISLLHMLPHARALATDLCPETVAIAAQNAAQNAVSSRLTLLCADFFDGALPIPDASLDALLANPPYIPSAVVDTLSAEVRAEPRRALDGGADGLDFYRALLPLYRRYLRPGGKILLEIGYDQGAALREIAASGGFACEIRKDLGGHDRVALLSPLAK